MTHEEIEAAVQQLLDRQAIHDCLMNYSRGVDRLDRELLLSTYHEDAIDDHGMFVGTREEFADWVITMHRDTHLMHQHALFNHSCDLDGDVAHTETYYMFAAMNRVGPPFVMSGGRYLDRFEKRSGHWAIAARLCVRDWAPLADRPDINDPSTMTAIRDTLPTAVRQFMASQLPTARDRNDPSYIRPLMIDSKRIAQGKELRLNADRR
ncbi:hypothetical protein AWC05_20805 [Mycobacterium florentinum]|uniref:SnoaL-like domain-containing protein n=1 Tax=Mycobacterium florentinum TaxID=292462 RepID=A0A1X1U956_MYCFL|nr:nuclear transport factor 2 family protein [Mycobacterium florentinum]MCV7410667.1 nuclear transport factor 2 family protein [Mycobacterium florentinum]ORV53199.1 hypothetical protein AWC05_20805 [Mycobacterium florentinum]BBX79994.1 hypothetical protein MFLOJ_37810 [Mycobacterium florentinum]